MDIRFGTPEGKGKIYREDGKIRLSMEKEGDIYRDIQKELEVGFLELREFKDSAVPGKMKALREYQSREDIMSLLVSFQRGYITNVVSVTHLEDKEYNLLEIRDLILNEEMEEESSIREYEKIYEYCLLADYEEKYTEKDIHIVQFSEVFIKFIYEERGKKILSINFQKEIFDIGELSNWITKNRIQVFSIEEDCVEDSKGISEGIKFEDNIILLYEKGFRDLEIDKSQLVEMREDLFPKVDRRNVFYSTKMKPYITKMDIVWDGERIDHIPEIELNKGDMLFVNNLHFLGASYFGSFQDDIGCFKDKKSKEPLAWIYDIKGTVYIRTEFRKDYKMIFVEYETSRIHL